MRALAVLASLAFGGCFFASTKVAMVRHGETFPPTQSVEMLWGVPDKPHTKIAIIETEGKQHSMTDMIKRLQSKGLEIGAHAIIVLDMQDKRDATLKFERNAVLRGIAIRWGVKP